MPALPSVFKIHFGHCFADASAELDDLNVIGMDRVGFQDRAIAKGRDQTGVVRSRRMQSVDTDRKTLNSRDYGTERPQLRHVIVTSVLRSVAAIFPHYDMGQHVLSL